MKKLLSFLALLLCSTTLIASPVNINSASPQVIADSLIGIGLKKAQAIVDYRVKNGPFKSIDDLTNVQGIAQKTIGRIKADILLSDSLSATPQKTIPTTVPHLSTEHTAK